ncbi:methyltransferase domain-containing protein [Mesobacillus sp. AQ2]|uniref:class I SAM-dependent methyltransferase n=1 Tax=unclassified Mesobacillus TaxID=2675270 RepID=UPI0020412FEF|nr:MULTISPECIES: class I SAM-dependent methyltransferase [unclassified Mesobacillus]MCM3123106.1 methyltransferase domain-containing protein [Mesobacillus sp. MER 33]MCM3233411.1 methyltransferase domain-containing protein [Mesobacillus sp. MER 48]WHX42460.1 methyltransferase domain-containing protein [Mesobacillus sp. AQ2]
MLSKQGFDLWANGYDKTVQVSEESGVYPFAGYRAILNAIFKKVMGKENARVLDIGFGTGVLTSKLYDHGHQIDGIDFSSRMIALAQPKMPKANLIEWDITNGLPEDIKAKKYDYIVSTYALHHLTDEEKRQFIRILLPMLEEKGKILIGDIAFDTRQELETCRHDSIDFWDEDEFYFVFDELQSMLKEECKLEFQAMSHCGGVIIITRT